MLRLDAPLCEVCMTPPTLDDVLVLAEQLSVADKALLLARIAPLVASEVREHTVRAHPSSGDIAKAASTPSHKSTPLLDRARGLLATDRQPPTDAEVEQWLAERRMERYGQ
jgi:hypothetical protein